MKKVLNIFLSACLILSLLSSIYAAGSGTDIIKTVSFKCDQIIHAKQLKDFIDPNKAQLYNDEYIEVTENNITTPTDTTYDFLSLTKGDFNICKDSIIKFTCYTMNGSSDSVFISDNGVKYKDYHYNTKYNDNVLINTNLTLPIHFANREKNFRIINIIAESDIFVNIYDDYSAKMSGYPDKNIIVFSTKYNNTDTKIDDLTVSLINSDENQIDIVQPNEDSCTYSLFLFDENLKPITDKTVYYDKS